MIVLLTLIHVIVALTLILIVLLQTGKGAGMGAAFGGSSETLFGASGPTSFLGKLTAGAAVCFMVTSLLLTYFSAASSTGSIVPSAPLRPASQSAPAESGAPKAPAPGQSSQPDAGKSQSSP